MLAPGRPLARGKISVHPSGPMRGAGSRSAAAGRRRVALDELVGDRVEVLADVVRLRADVQRCVALAQDEGRLPAGRGRAPDRAVSAFYVSNAGSGTVSAFSDPGGGTLTSLGNTPADAGTVDASATPDGRYLYVQAGINGIVDEYRVGQDGSLTEIGSVTVPQAAGGEGIAAS